MEDITSDAIGSGNRRDSPRAGEETQRFLERHVREGAVYHADGLRVPPRSGAARAAQLRQRSEHPGRRGRPGRGGAAVCRLEQTRAVGAALACVAGRLHQEGIGDRACTQGGRDVSCDGTVRPREIRFAALCVF